VVFKTKQNRYQSAHGCGVIQIEVISHGDREEWVMQGKVVQSAQWGVVRLVRFGCGQRLHDVGRRV
jgi:hypothetical protein